MIITVFMIYVIIIHTSSIPAPCFHCKVLLTSRMGEFMTVETIIVLHAWTTHWATKKITTCCHLLEWFGMICFLNVPNWNFLKKHQKSFPSWFSAKYPALIFTSLWKKLWNVCFTGRLFMLHLQPHEHSATKPYHLFIKKQGLFCCHFSKNQAHHCLWHHAQVGCGLTPL